MQGIWDWPWEGTLLTNGRWDGSQKSCYSLTLFTSGTPGPSCPRDRVSQGLETLVSGLPGPVFPLTTSIHVACGRPLPSPSAQQRCLPLGQQPGKRWVTNGMSDLSAFFPHPALLVSLLAPPRPPARGLHAAKEAAWEDLPWVEGRDIWFSKQEGSGN